MSNTALLRCRAAADATLVVPPCLTIVTVSAAAGATALWAGQGYWDYLFSVDSLSRYQAFAIGFLAVMWFRWFHCTLFSAVARPSGEALACSLCCG